MASINGSLIQRETLNDDHFSPNTAIPRSKLAQTPLAVFPIPIHAWRTHDAFATNLPGTPANDDLGIVDGTWGTDVMTIQTGDLKTTTTTRYAKARLTVPENYDDGTTLQLRFRAGMITTVADASATLDVEAYRVGDDGAVDGADLYTGAALTINSLTEADKDFALTVSGLDPGDEIEVRIAITVTDSGTGTAVIGCIYRSQLLADVK